MAAHKLFVSLAALFVLVLSVEALTITDCTKGKKADAVLKSVSISNCDPAKDTYCRLVVGTNTTIEVDFVTTEAFKATTVDIYGKIGGMPIPFPISPNDACGNYGFNCPVQKNQEKTLKISLPVLSVYPKIALKCQLKMFDELKRPIVCLEFPVKITK